MWSGAEYRGRGREVFWNGKAALHDNRIERVAAVNFLNPDKPIHCSKEQGRIAWQSVTTGNMAGFDLWLERERTGRLSIESNVISSECDLAKLDQNEVTIQGGGLQRKLCIYRLPEQNSAISIQITHQVTDTRIEDRDLPIYVRVTQQDGHQAWSSPIYLIRNP
jgi:hypothetical protein